MPGLIFKTMDFIELLEQRFNHSENNHEKLLLMYLLGNYYREINNNCKGGHIIQSKLHKVTSNYIPKTERISTTPRYRAIFYQHGAKCKICDNCNEIKILSEFYKAAYMKTGRQHICRTCNKIKYYNYVKKEDKFNGQ